MICLNCSTEFEGNFCPNCAQRASTRRFTFRQLFTRDFLADTFNFDRGFLHTCISMFYRPGYAIADYLSGHRKEYFNFIGFLLILLGVEAILWGLGINTPAEVMVDTMNKQLAESNPMGAMALTLEDVEAVFRNQKFLFIPAIPLAALVPFLLLRRLKYNFLEHCIIVCFLLSMNTLMGISFGILGLLPLSFETYKAIYFPISFVVILYDFFLFWQLARNADYSVFGRLWRTVVSGFVAIFIIGMTQQFAMGIMAGKRGHAEQTDGPATELPATQPAEEVPAPGN